MAGSCLSALFAIASICFASSLEVFRFPISSENGFSITRPFRNLRSVWIENASGPIEVVGIEGSQIVLHVSDLKFTGGEKTHLQISEQSGIFRISIDYPVGILSPQEYQKEFGAFEDRAKGVLFKEGKAILLGSYVGLQNEPAFGFGDLKLVGHLGEAKLKVQIPQRWLYHLRISTFSSEVKVSHLPENKNIGRVIWLDAPFSTPELLEVTASRGVHGPGRCAEVLENLFNFSGSELAELLRDQSVELEREINRTKK